MKCQVFLQPAAKALLRARNKCSVLLVIGTTIGLSASSQSFIGYGYDNYSGVNSLLLNPGMLAGSKYKVNVNLFSVSGLAGNNAYELDSKKLFSLKLNHLSEGDGYYKSANTATKYAYFNTDILGPSAMFNIDRKDAIGIITRMRTVGNEYNLGNPLFQLMGTSNPSFQNIDIINRSLQTKVQGFAEAGLSYGRVLFDHGNKVLKIGITGKYIAGLAYGSVSSGQMTINIDPANNIGKLDGDVTTRYSSNMDNIGDGGSISKAFNKANGHGWGADVGFVYEYKPNGDVYKMRLGVSVTDIGSVNYTNSPNSQTYMITADGHNTSELMKQSGEDFNQYFQRLQTDGLVVSKANGTTKLKATLPTAVHVNADYDVYKRIYINADVLLNTIANTNPISPNYVSTLTVTPRLEKKWVSVYSPVSYNVQGQLNWGAGVRLGPLFVGSGSVLSDLLKKRVQAADVHVGLTIPIFQQSKSKKKKDEDDDKKKKNDSLYRNIKVIHDRDSDGVVDEKDACPDSAGPVALLGCPDDDGDGVPNYKDKCPGVKGSPNFEGCPAPDTDGDSVNDDEDRCPLVKGTVANHGCPAISQEDIDKVNGAASKIFFLRARYDVEANCQAELDRVVTVLQSDSTLHIIVRGHTDSEGTDARNAVLSLRRAKSVKAYLVSKGIAPNRIETHGYGAHRPLASNETLEGMAQNRRVELELMNWQK